MKILGWPHCIESHAHIIEKHTDDLFLPCDIRRRAFLPALLVPELGFTCHAIVERMKCRRAVVQSD
jgi:hypothetical protein